MMILDAYESPSSGLSNAVPYVKRFEKNYISVQFVPLGPIHSSTRNPAAALRVEREVRGMAARRRLFLGLCVCARVRSRRRPLRDAGERPKNAKYESARPVREAD